ncbi:hypothetical protein [Thermus islandicus]|nr:hypothetical protein [Thermus islandicus]
MPQVLEALLLLRPQGGLARGDLEAARRLEAHLEELPQVLASLREARG